MDATFNNPFEIGTQPHTLLERCRRGPANNYEFRALGMLAYTRIITTVRRALEPQGYTLKKNHVKGGVYAYELAKLPPRRSWWGRIKEKLREVMS